MVREAKQQRDASVVHGTGGTMTADSFLRIATVTSASIEGALNAVATCTDADRIEVRLDALWPTPPEPDTAADHLIALTETAQVPLLATLRPLRQGGRFDGPEEVRLSLLDAAAKAGFHAVDVEGDNADLLALIGRLRQDANEIVASIHRPDKAPDKDSGLMQLQAMQDARADIQKIAFPAGAFPDYLRALEIAHRFRNVHGRPAPIPLGYGGAMGRALLPLAGARAMYGHAAGSAPAVSGQPALQDIQSVWDRWGLTKQDLDEASNRWLAVVGDPVDHSRSPALHNAWLRAAGRPERYGALTVPDSMGAVRLLFGVADRIGLVGAGVTAPLKVHALDASQPDDTARAVGAANTVRFREGRIESTNTDSTGLQSLLHEHDGPVAVIGAGGAARAAIHAAQTLGLDVTFTSKDPQRASAVRDRLGATWVPWDERHNLDATAWVQCTSLGSRPDDPSPLPTNAKPTLAIEMVYAAGTTAFERQARDANARVIDGITVLENQAADQYRFWTDEDPPGGIE